MYFSAERLSFYPEEFRSIYERSGSWPPDAKKVTSHEYATYGQASPPAGMQLAATSDGHPSWIEIPPEPADARRLRKLNAIDTAAGRARLRYVSAGQLIEEEYRQAKLAVAEWRADGSPTDAVPHEIQSGAEYSGISVEASAVEIEQTAEAWEGALAQIRELRLSGKRAVRESSSDKIESTAQIYIDLLEAVAPN